MSGSQSSRAESLERVRIVVDRLRARHAEIARAIYDEIRVAVPDSVGGRDPTYQAGILEAVTAVLSYSLDVIGHGPGWSGPIPPEAASQARRAARVGVGAGVILRRYVTGHRRLGEFVAEEAKCTGVESDLAALGHIRRTQEALLEHLTAAVEHEHDQERERIARSPEQRRVELVQRLLDGEFVRRAELGSLVYAFDAWHVAMIAMGANARAALESLKADRQLLLVSHGEETVWAWLGGQRRLAHADMERLRLQSDHADVSLALGEPAKGIHGWRETNEQARQALQVVLLGRQKHARFADVAVLTPWVENRDRARSFVEQYLTPLYSQKDGGVTSCNVLRAYFETARNVSAAARKLGLERRTLAYRLETIEECLGYPLQDRFTELDVALRLRGLLENNS